MSLENYIKVYQLDNIFPTRYFDKLQVLQLSSGCALCLQGETLNALFYLVKGKLKIVHRLFNGKEHILDIKESPTLIGDIELLTNQSAISSVIALKDSLIIQLPLNDIRKQVLTDCQLLLNLSKGLAKSLCEQNIRASTNLNYTLKERLATYILTIEENGVFKLDLTSLSNSFAVSYRHLLRVIHCLVDEKIIEKHKPYYHIKNKSQLLKLNITD